MYALACFLLSPADAQTHSVSVTTEPPSEPEPSRLAPSSHITEVLRSRSFLGVRRCCQQSEPFGSFSVTLGSHICLFHTHSHTLLWWQTRRDATERRWGRGISWSWSFSFTLVCGACTLTRLTFWSMCSDLAYQSFSTFYFFFVVVICTNGIYTSSSPKLLCGCRQPKTLWWKQPDPFVCNVYSCHSVRSCIKPVECWYLPGQPPLPHSFTLALRGWGFLIS